MCKSSLALPAAELCAPCQREFEGLSEKPCLAVLRFDMAQRAALQAQQRTEDERLSELKTLFSSRSRFVRREEDEILPISSGELRASARREVGQNASVAGKVKIHRSPRGTVRHKLEALASSEAKHAAARAIMDRRRRIRRGEVVCSEEEEEDEDEQDTLERAPFRRPVDRCRGVGRVGLETHNKPKHVSAQQMQQTRRNAAFCMGIHRRVGRDSPMFGLPESLVRSILSVVDDALLDLRVLAEHSLLSPMGPSKATRGAVTTLVADTNTWRLFAGGEDGSIVVWDYATCRQQQVLRGHSSAIRALVIIMNRETTPLPSQTSERKNQRGVRGDEQAPEDVSCRISLLQLRFPEHSMNSLKRLLRYHRGNTDAATAYIEAHSEGNGVQETPCVAAASSSPAGASSARGQPSTQRGVSKFSPKKQHKAERPGAVPILSNECGFLLVSGCAQGVVVWIRKQSGCLSIRQRLHCNGCGPVDNISALAGGEGSLPLLVCGGKRCEVHLWDLQAEPTGSVGLRHSMSGHHAPITALAMPHHDQATAQSYLHSKSSADASPSFSDAAEWLWCVSGCMDGTIRRWDLVRGVATHILESHDSPVTSLALVPVRSSSQFHEARVTTGKEGAVGFWRLFSGGDTNDGCIRCWDTFECFSAATEAKNTHYRYDQGGGRSLSAAQATASGSSRLLGHKIDVSAGVKSMHWVSPSLVGETRFADEAFDTACTYYAGWLCCTLTNQSVIALRAADCAGRGKIDLGSCSPVGRNLKPPGSSLVGIFRSTVASARARERGQFADAAGTVAVPVPLHSSDTCASTTARAKKAVMIVCAVGDKMRIFTTTE